MRVLFAGTPLAAVPSLRALLGSSHDVVTVLTRPDARAGRGRQLASSPVAEVATKAALPVWKASTLRDEAALDRLRSLEVDVAAVVAYGALIPASMLEVPRHGWVNLHLSLLPAWRGAAPVQHALLAGDSVTGATTFRLDQHLDTGPVLGRVTEPVRAKDTAGELLDRLSVSGASLLVATLDAMDRGDVVAVPQSSEGASLAPKLTARDAKLSWERPALALERQVRACDPAPGAWTTVAGERLKVCAASVATASDVLAPGELRVEPDGVLVGTGSTPLRLERVQPAGGRPMDAAAWARGARLAAGTRLT